MYSEMACRISVNQQMADPDVLLLSPAPNEHSPRKFKKPTSRLPPPVNLDELYESTDISSITPAHPKAGFKLSKKPDPSFKGFSKALETTHEDESLLTHSQSKKTPFKCNFRLKKGIRKINATFSKAFETASDQDLTLNQKEQTFKVANFRSNKEKVKSNFTFSKGFEISSKLDSLLLSSQSSKMSNFKHNKRALKQDSKFSQALESSIGSDFVHTMTHSCNGNESYGEKFRPALIPLGQTISSHTFAEALAESTIENSKRFEISSKHDSLSLSSQRSKISNFKHRVFKHDSKFSQNLESSNSSNFVHKLTHSRNSNESFGEKSRTSLKLLGQTNSSHTFSEDLAKSSIEKSTRSSLESNLDEQMSDTSPNPIEKFAQTLSNISPILPEKMKDIDNVFRDISTKSSRQFSTNLSEISEESFNNDADTSSSVGSSESMNTVYSLSRQLTPVLNEIAAEIDKENCSEVSNNSSKIEHDDRDGNDSVALTVSNIDSNFSSDCEEKSKKCLKVEDGLSPSPVRKRCKSSHLRLRRYWKRRTPTHSNGAFTDHDLSLHLLSKCLRPKKPIPVFVRDTSSDVQPPVSNQGGRQKTSELQEFHSSENNCTRLKRPTYWATNKLYNFLREKVITEHSFQSKIEAEEFVNLLAKIVHKTIQSIDLEERDRLINKLKSRMKELQVIKSDFYFYHFIHEFLPVEFVDLAVPTVLPFSGKLNVLNYKPGNLFKKYYD